MTNLGATLTSILLLITIYIHCIYTLKAAAMRLVVQRVKSASVTVDGSIVSSIGPGAM